MLLCLRSRCCKVENLSIRSIHPSFLTGLTWLETIESAHPRETVQSATKSYLPTVVQSTSHTLNSIQSKARISSQHTLSHAIAHHRVIPITDHQHPGLWCLQLAVGILLRSGLILTAHHLVGEGVEAVELPRFFQ